MHRGHSAHQRYLDSFEIVQQRDREMARVFDDLRRWRALVQAQIHADGLLTEQEFAGLSPQMRSAVSKSLQRDG